MRPSTQGPPTRRLPPCCQFHETPTSPHPPRMTEAREGPASIRPPGARQAVLRTQRYSQATFLFFGTRGRESVGRAPLDGRPRSHPGHTPPLVCYRQDEPHLQAPDGPTVRIPADAFLPQLGRDRLRVMVACPDEGNRRRVHPSTGVLTRYRSLRLCSRSHEPRRGTRTPTPLQEPAPHAGETGMQRFRASTHRSRDVQD